MASLSAETDGETADEERRLRLRVLLTEYRTVAVVALVALVALGAWVSYGVYADPGEETNRQRVHAWTATGDVSHGATVTEPNAIYADGTRLENEPLYYTAITPSLDGEFVAGYESRTGDDVRIELTVDLVYRAVDPDRGTVYWSERERLASARETDVQPGENVTAPFTVNVSAVTSRIDEIETDLGASPGETEIALEFERQIDGTVGGEGRSVADGYRVPITATDGTYRLEGENSFDETYEEYETETVPASAGPARTVGGPLLVLIGVGGLAGLAFVSRRVPTPTTAEREWLAYRDDRDRFEDVITPVALPDAALEGPRADLDTLAALAEFGIDVGSAIVFDPERERYVVRDDDVTYVFEPPGRPSAATAGDDRITFSDASLSSSASADGDAADGDGGISEPETSPAGEVDDEDLLALAGLREEDLVEPEPIGPDARPADDSRSAPTESDAGDRGNRPETWSPSESDRG